MNETTLRQVVVVGNGMVGQRFVDDFVGTDGWSCTVIGEEPHAAYDRVALSSFFDGSTLEDLSLCDVGALESAGVSYLLGRRVVSIDRDNRCVCLDDEQQIGYDHLVLAMGSSPFVPPIPGRDAATGDSVTNRWIRRCAKIRGVVVNAVDDLPNCDVTVPAVIRRGPATIAITTGGASPAGARFLREELTAVVDHAIPDEFSALLTHASDTRSRLRHHGGYRFEYNGWRQRFFEPLHAALQNGASRSTLAALAQRFEDEERAAVEVRRAGSVCLVGAGPGGADLITVRGANELAKADVVVYDRLADPELLALAPVAAERLPVGKGKGFGASQQEINDLLIERARQGDRVVRLKGGDPFVFGRGGEEVDALTAAGIAVDVVPGVSSALGAPGLAGISVTDRRYVSSFTVVTGHAIRRGDDEWAYLARSNSTLVVLMAASTAADVATELIVHGRASDEPVAFVHRAGRADQEVAHLPLAIVAQEGCPFGSPTVMVIGEAARDRDAGHLAARFAQSPKFSLEPTSGVASTEQNTPASLST